MLASRIVATVTVAALGACGGPVLQNAPHPDPAVVAGAAAAVAGAATLADPDSAAKKKESRRRDGEPELKARTADEQVPADVLDRLDDAEAVPDDAGKPAPDRKGTDDEQLPAGLRW